jgi:hypothetical protein
MLKLNLIMLICNDCQDSFDRLSNDGYSPSSNKGVAFLLIIQ